MTASGRTSENFEDAAAGTHRPQHQSDPRPHGGHIADRGPVDLAVGVNRRRNDARLCSRYHLRDHHRYFIVDLYRLTDPAFPRRKPPAAVVQPSFTAEGSDRGAISFFRWRARIGAAPHRPARSDLDFEPHLDHL